MTSVTLTVAVTKRQEKDGVTLAKPVQSGVKLLVDTAVDGILVDTSMQVDEDSLLGDLRDETDLFVDESVPTNSILLCILGELNGIEVTFHR